MLTDLNAPSATASMIPPIPSDRAGQASAQNLNQYQIIRRNGAVVPFEPNKIAVALMKAFWLSTAHKALHLPACGKW